MKSVHLIVVFITFSQRFVARIRANLSFRKFHVNMSNFPHNGINIEKQYNTGVSLV